MIEQQEDPLSLSREEIKEVCKRAFMQGYENGFYKVGTSACAREQFEHWYKRFEKELHE